MTVNMIKKLAQKARIQILAKILSVSVLGLGLSASVFAADRFIETVAKKADSGVVSSVRQLCLKDQSTKVADDVIAVLNKASGKIMADKGKGFVTAPPGTLLKEGDRVVSLEDSTAEVVFFDCCAASLKSNSLIAVNATPGCKAAVVDAATPAAAVAAVHPASWIPPAVGAFILIKGISLE